MSYTPSEQLVQELCNSTFLSLWSHANPRGKQNKEVCDVLIVCDPDVIVFSVKDVGLTEADNQDAAARWRRKAVDASIKQLDGAVRFLASATSVRSSDGNQQIVLPPLDVRRMHRVAIALGSAGDVLVTAGDSGKGFTHVFDDLSFAIILKELDSITDFVEYLRAKEELVKKTSPVVVGGEQHLLAVYLHNGRRFPDHDADLLLIDEGSWDRITQKPEWHRRKDADEISYFWDKLIEQVAADIRGPGLEFGAPDQAERVMRVMARESRFNRRVLSETFGEFLRDATARKTRSRIVPSNSGVHYVFLAAPASEPRQDRARELYLRSIVARSRMTTYAPVVGLAREHYQPGVGSTLDSILVDINEWTAELQGMAEGVVRDLGYFRNPVSSRSRHDEFPAETPEN